MFQKQAVMRKVLISLAPLLVFSIFLYGFKSIGIFIITFTLGIFTEWLFVRKTKQKVSEAVLVTCSLYALSMPPLVPLWIVGIGIIFGIAFGKMVYGGFGRNIFNPAIAGRLFIYISFPNTVNQWLNPRSLDGFAGATPLAMLKNGELPPLLNLFTGFKSGSIGEGSIILIFIAFVYLISTKTASYRSSISTIIGFLIMQSILYFMNLGGANPIYSLFSGSILFLAVFMVTDPVSSPKKNSSLILYGLLIGVFTSLIRTYSLFLEGTSFAILLGNMFAPLFDETIGKLKGGYRWKKIQ
ncbi:MULTISPECIES: RnfABCDGE type electron transport complex subunit D [Psychrilyobacter]|nr:MULTISPECIES: RnfABCDGE type electron transport complex subunit D [Psychrilyobacter]MCS5422255.1 RnfABCDGE type electron transport complex subunit D [Psychrilyobacter sp. S5]